jgi:undecaprenyl phosphate-alpha-L-ara4N flippase subunit ArnE
VLTRIDRAEMMNVLAWLQLLAVVALGTGAQLALKVALGHNGIGRNERAPRTLIGSPLMWLWFACYVASTLLWLWVLREVPLSQAFPILGLQFALVPIAASCFLREGLDWAQWLGVTIIVAGVALVGAT